MQIFLLFLIFFRPHLSNLGSYGCGGRGGWLGLVLLGFVTAMAEFMVGGDGGCVAGFEVVGGGWFVLAFSSA